MAAQYGYRILVAGVVYAILAQVIHLLGTIPTMSFYLDPQYFQVWSRIMMPEAGPPPASFLYYSVIISLVLGMLYASTYYVIRNGVPGSGVVKGLTYGCILFISSGIPFSLTLYLLVNVPPGLILYWSVESLAIYIISGAVFSKMIH